MCRSEWTKRATEAALKLSGDGGCKTISAGNELLADIQDVFESKRISKISYGDLIAALLDDAEKSWATYNRGKPITMRQVTKQLKKYHIMSKSIRFGYNRRRVLNCPNLLMLSRGIYQTPRFPSHRVTIASEPMKTPLLMLPKLLPVTELPVTESNVTEPSVTSNTSVTCQTALLLDVTMLLTLRDVAEVRIESIL